MRSLIEAAVTSDSGLENLATILKMDASELAAALNVTVKDITAK